MTTPTTTTRCTFCESGVHLVEACTLPGARQWRGDPVIATGELEIGEPRSHVLVLTQKSQFDILNDVLAERTRQDAQWGGVERDDDNAPWQWRMYREKFENRAGYRLRILSADNLTDSERQDVERGRDALVKLVALGLAQLESIDRKVPRT
jgi:hypothetical protein